MQISERGIDLIKRFEGFRSRAYKDAVGVWTIGYGTTRINGEPVRPGQICSEKEALEWLRKDAEEYWEEAKKYINPDVKLSQNQVDALASFIYNVGVDNFKKSTLLKLLNKHDFLGAAEQFPRWVYAGGKVLQGLVRRRDAECRMFLGIDGDFDV